MKFGFIVHPRSIEELRRSLPPYGFPYYPLGSNESLMTRCLEEKIVKEFYTFKDISSAIGTSCSGGIYCIYLAPEQFINHQTLALELMGDACNHLKDWGAEVIGLGGLTGVVGSRGKELSEKVSIPVTTGNSFTVYASLKVLERIVRLLGINLLNQKVTIIGFPGSISLAIAQILAKKGVELILVSKRETPFLKQFVSLIKDTTDVNIDTTYNLDEGLRRSKIILSATSTGRIIDPDKLLPGTIVIDIAQPRDVIEKRRMRNDVLIVDGGIVTLPQNGRRGYKLFGWGRNDVPGCLGETIILALEDRREAFSIGRRLAIEKIYEIGSLGEKHGFVADNLRHFKKPISEGIIQDIAKRFYK